MVTYKNSTNIKALKLSVSKKLRNLRKKEASQEVQSEFISDKLKKLICECLIQSQKRQINAASLNFLNKELEKSVINKDLYSFLRFLIDGAKLQALSIDLVNAMINENASNVDPLMKLSLVELKKILDQNCKVEKPKVIKPIKIPIINLREINLTPIYMFIKF